MDVSLLWNDVIPLRGAIVDGIVRPLRDLIKETRLRPTVHPLVLGHPDPSWRILPRQLARIWIERSKANFWVSHAGGAIPTLGPEDIRRLIKAKELKIPGYRPVSELWLLVVAAGWNTSGFCEVSSALETFRFRTSFDRLFFLHDSEGHVWELQCESST